MTMAFRFYNVYQTFHLARFIPKSQTCHENKPSFYKKKHIQEQIETLIKKDLPTNVRLSQTLGYFVIKIGNGHGQWLFPRKSVLSFWLFRFSTETNKAKSKLNKSSHLP